MKGSRCRYLLLYLFLVESSLPTKSGFPLEFLFLYITSITFTIYLNLLIIIFFKSSLFSSDSTMQWLLQKSRLYLPTKNENKLLVHWSNISRILYADIKIDRQFGSTYWIWFRNEVMYTINVVYCKFHGNRNGSLQLIIWKVGW